MTVIRLLLACIMVTVLPAAVGTIFLPLKTGGARVLLAWIYGQICLWAGFLFVCVPMVLLKKEFPQVERTYFGFCALMLLLSGACFLLRKKKRATEGGEPLAAKAKRERSRGALLLWICFGVILAIQIFCVFYLRYEDGDDAYYVAITSYAKEVKALYRNIPYTGQYTELDVRHALAPFPVWVAVLADVAGLSGAATAHAFMPVFILAITYGLFYLLGERLLLTRDGLGESWRMPLFMTFAGLLVTFGGYSIYSAENFLIVRAGQGKAVLANVAIPALLYAVVLMMQRLEKQEKLPVSLWIMICAAMTTGCLCSTLGSFLLCVFLGVVILCGLVIYRRWTLIIGGAASVAVPLVMAAIYVFMA